MVAQLSFPFPGHSISEPRASLGVAPETRDAQVRTLYVRESSSYVALTDDQVLAYARRLIRCGLRRGARVFENLAAVRNFLQFHLSGLDHEVFGCLYLDPQLRLLEMEELFRGTIDHAAVYPREVLKAAIRHGASALLVYHNHPSGHAEPSRADEAITRRLREALALVDITLLDHLIVGDSIFSFSELGLL